MVTPRFAQSPPMATNRPRNGGQFLRQAVLLLLFPLLLLAMSLPASAVSVLKSLTIAKPVIFGIGSTTGTVTLSATSTTATSVVLKSGNANVHVPATVSVNAGSLTASFTISTVAAYAKPAQVTISGAAGGWLQSSVLAGVPAAYPVSIQNLKAGYGNGCVLLMWQDLEPESYRGYNIYKISGATATKLNATPQTTSLYAISGLTNGTTYQYAVSVVDASGVESARSATVSAIPSATIEKLSWVLPPTTATDHLTLYVATPLNTVTGTILLIDGKQASGGGASSDPGHSGQDQTDIDTTFLTNGAHTFQMIGFVGDHSCATPPQSITVTNDFSGLDLSYVFQQDQGEVCAIKTTFPTGTTQWTVQVLDDSDVVLRTWSGTPASIQLAWDGTDATGVAQANGNYFVLLTAFDAQNLQKQTKKHIALVKGYPNALVLINEVSLHHSDDVALETTIESQLKIIQGNNSGFTSSVQTIPNKVPVSVLTIRNIRKAMGSTVTDFYLFSHGNLAKGTTPPFGFWGGCSFWGASLPITSDMHDEVMGRPDTNIIIPDATMKRQYNFAMMDCCFTAGGKADGTPTSTIDKTFHDAFNIGNDINFASVFLGWDGYMWLNTYPADTGTISTNTGWLTWRQNFWTRLAAGDLVSQAVAYAMANQATGPCPIFPWDTNRSQFIGDQETPFP